MKEPYLMKWLKTFSGKYGVGLLFKSREAKILKPAVSLKSTIFTPTKICLKMINTEDYKMCTVDA